MPKRFEVYKCELCGNVVEVTHGADGALVCCGEDMKLLDEQTADSAKEKHVPVVEGTKVKVGSVPHPMEEKHYIEWIEIVCPEGGGVCRRYLKPGDEPEAELLREGMDKVIAREYCTVHGLWKA
ncbi:MAG: desulfoferrodoxin [Planctomycetota bacterium]|jgi:superoxide reductase